MTGQRDPAESVKADRAAKDPASPDELESILQTCDVVLGEVGRRRHLFSWLRAPSAAGTAWLPVDAYYPRRRLVLVCDPDPTQASTYREQVLAHGLALVQIEIDTLGSDAAARRSTLERTLREVSPTPASTTDRSPERLHPPRERPPFATFTTLMQPAAAPTLRPRRLSDSQVAAVERAARLLRARRALSPQLPAAERQRTARGRTPAPRRVSHVRTRSSISAARETVHVSPLGLDSVVIALTLAAVLCVEGYLGVIHTALGAREILLGVAIVIDGCARAFGAIAALKLDRLSWAWACVLGGSPVVAGFALFQQSGPVDAEPAPLAGLLSLVALALAAIALIVRLLAV